MSNSPCLNLVVGGEDAPGGGSADQPAAAAPGGSIHLHIHLGRAATDRVPRDADEGRPGKGRARPVLTGLGVAAALAVASFYAGQHSRLQGTGEATPAAAAALAPAARLPFGAAAPRRLPGMAEDGLPPALRAQLAAPPTVIPPPAPIPNAAPPSAPAPPGSPRGTSSFGLGD